MQTGALATGLTHVMASWEAAGSYTYLELTLPSRHHGLGDGTKSQLFLRTYRAQGLVPDGSRAQR